MAFSGALGTSKSYLGNFTLGLVDFAPPNIDRTIPRHTIKRCDEPVPWIVWCLFLITLIK